MDTEPSEWRGPAQAATVIGRAIWAARFSEATERIAAEGIAPSTGVAALAQRYADGVLRLPELVYMALARAVYDAAREQTPADLAAFGARQQARAFMFLQNAPAAMTRRCP